MQSRGWQPRLAENKRMGDNKSARVVVRRRSTAAKSDDSAELELVSTQMLKQILSSNDAENRKAVGDAAKTPGDGVLARDPATGFFEIIENLKAPKAWLVAPVDRMYDYKKGVTVGNVDAISLDK